MSIVDKDQKFFGRFCIDCGALLLADQTCSNCAAKSDTNPSGADPLIISVNLSVLHCEKCHRVFSIGTLACPDCGEPIDSSEPTDPIDGPLNKIKLDALGGFLPEFYRIVDFPKEEKGQVPYISDDQFLSYINRHNIVSSERLIGNLKGFVSRINLSNETTIRSPETLVAFEGVLSAARELREIYDELRGFHASEQLSHFHLQAIAVFRTALDVHVTSARAILALTIEELQLAERDLQASLDRLEVIGQIMASEIEAADPDVMGLNRIQRRLDLFVREPGRYEHSDRPDLAAVLVARLSEGRDFARLGQEKAGYFGKMLLVDPSTLPSEQGLALYVLAAQVSASEDPVTLKRWSNVLLDVFNEAFRQNPVAMESAVSAADLHIEEAVVHLLSVDDTLRSLRIDELPIEAVRQQLASSYLILVEWSHRHLLNLLLAAKFVLRGKPKAYEQIAVADWATKRDWLSKPDDPRYAPAFLYVSAKIRNAGAHGDVDTSGAKIRFIVRNKDRTKILDVEELTENEFVGRLRDLLLTCDALRLAAELFRIEHFHELPLPQLPTRARVMDEVANIIVGYFGLVRARTRRHGEELVAVEAEVAEGMLVKDPRDYLSAAFTVATLFPTHTTAELRVIQSGELKCRIQTPVAEVITQQELSEDIRTYYLLKISYLSIVEPSVDSNGHHRYRQQLILPASRLLMQDIAAAQQLRADLPATKQEYEAALASLVRKADLLINVLRDIDTPKTSEATRDSLLLGLDSLRQGLIEHQRLLRAGQWPAINRRSERLQRGVRILGRWSN